MPVEDYYSLIGVSSDADRDSIKSAYRTRRAELDDSESSKAKAAKLNKAWNVLSDTGQREKYDDQLAVAKASDDVIVPEIMTNGSSSNGRGPKPRGERASRARRTKGDRPVRQPVVQRQDVNGTALASTRSRMIALAIDATICLIVLVVSIGVVSQKLIDSYAHADDVKSSQLQDSTSVLNKAATAAKDTNDKAKNNLNAAIKRNASKSELEKLTETKNAANTRYTAAKGLFDAKNKEYVSASKKLSPYQLGAYEGGLAVLAVLFVGLALTTGRSPGKFVTKLHLIGADGQRASVSAILIRYLVVFGFMAILGVFLGQIAWVIAIFGVSSSARSPQRQGWHDRIAKTYVAQG